MEHGDKDMKTPRNHTLLGEKNKKNILILFCLALITAVFETAGIMSIFPLISLITQPEIIQQNKVTRYLFEFANPQSVQWFLMYLSIALAVVMALSLLFKVIYYHYQYKFSLMIERDIGTQLMRGYLKKSYLWHINKHSGELAKNILSQTSIVVAEVIIPFVSTLVHSLIIIFILTVLLWIYPRTTVALAIVLSIGYMLPILILKKLAVKTGEERMCANEQRFKVVGEALGGVKEVKVFQAENYFSSRYDNNAKKYAEKTAAGKTLSILPKYILEGFVFGGFLAVIIYSLANNIDLNGIIPVLSVFAAASYKLMPSLQQVYSNIMSITHSLKLYTQLRDELAGIAVSEKGHKSEELSRVKDAVEFDQVRLSFDHDMAPFIKIDSIKFPACTSVGLVGPSGSGKSTLVDLLSGVHLPTSGSILCDGIPITQDNLMSWKNKIGYLPQNIYLLDDTITANIAFGKFEKEINFDRLYSAAKRANIHQFIINDMPNGYSTIVGERGVRLSGGQRQRIGLARALYRKTEIIILDEATSALDNITEQLFVSSIEELKKDHIVVIIAHRLSTIKNCDYIYYIDNGSIVRFGNYQELITNSEEFRKLARADVAINEEA